MGCALNFSSLFTLIKRFYEAEQEQFALRIQPVKVLKKFEEG